MVCYQYNRLILASSILLDKNIVNLIFIVNEHLVLFLPEGLNAEIKEHCFSYNCNKRVTKVMLFFVVFTQQKSSYKRTTGTLRPLSTNFLNCSLPNFTAWEYFSVSMDLEDFLGCFFLRKDRNFMNTILAYGVKHVNPIAYIGLNMIWPIAYDCGFGLIYQAKINREKNVDKLGNKIRVSRVSRVSGVSRGKLK